MKTKQPKYFYLPFLVMVNLFFYHNQTFAALFSEDEEIKLIKPEAALGLDGSLTLDFAWRSDLGFDAKKLNIMVTYAATKPEAKGIKTITTKSCSQNPQLPIPSGCNKYTRPLQYRFVVPASWISQSANKINIQLAERIKGVGDYQLLGLRFNCPQQLCPNKSLKFPQEGLYDSNFMLGFDKPYKDNKQHTLLLGHNVASSFTGQYNGVIRGLTPSQGAYDENYAETFRFPAGDISNPYKTLQAKNGQWHFSELAFRERYDGSCARSYQGPRFNAKQYVSMQWAQAFSTNAYGDVYDTFEWDKNNKRAYKTPAQWTGCVAFLAESDEDSSADEEVRFYHFEKGKLYKRRVDWSRKGVHYSETVVLNSQQQLDIFDSRQYVDKTAKETNISWNKLFFEAYPQTKPAPKVNLPALLQESEDVLKIIEPEFKEKP